MSEAWLPKLLAFVASERRCCPFFAFELAFEPRRGPLWLRIRGSAAVKAFLEQIGARDRPRRQS